MLLVLILCPYVTSYLYWDWHYFLVPFTNWTLLVTTISLLLTIYASGHPQHFSQTRLEKKTKTLDQPDFDSSAETCLRIQAAHHMLYTLAIMMNVVVMSVYWTLLHKD